MLSDRVVVNKLTRMAEEYIGIGKILKPQGHNGAVRVLPLTDYPDRFNKMSRVLVRLKNNRQEFNIENVYPHKKYLIIKFEEIQDMDAAERFKGGILEITRSELMPLEEGSYYIFDIIGLKVFNIGGELLGEITEVLQTGANDVYVLETGDRPILIPALKHVVKEIDLSGRKMVVELPRGLVD